MEGSAANYENLDNAQTGIHDFGKWCKFAFGRATDIASMHVRRGRLTRREAVEAARRHDGRYPETYLGISLQDVLAEIGLTRSTFDLLVDRFTNRALFKTTSDGALIRRPDGSPERLNEP
ncbi:hypothetical protein A2198_02600 [Candidatus Peribacteria bacterium RIFOXYA1_FULL_56_14]|nr:MAG: hypothetical protein A2198_02600 [Candidatus Peribacteria bacterium RIFOXYA1_FULL_56_14]